jgi:enoyl-CoA hydratase/carnithine racemase
MSIETRDWKHLEVTTDDGVVVVRLNRPEKRNALSLGMMAELTEVATARRSVMPCRWE